MACTFWFEAPKDLWVDQASSYSCHPKLPSLACDLFQVRLCWKAAWDGLLLSVQFMIWARDCVCVVLSLAWGIWSTFCGTVFLPSKSKEKTEQLWATCCLLCVQEAQFRHGSGDNLTRSLDQRLPNFLGP